MCLASNWMVCVPRELAIQILTQGWRCLLGMEVSYQSLTQIGKHQLQLTMTSFTTLTVILTACAMTPQVTAFSTTQSASMDLRVSTILQCHFGVRSIGAVLQFPPVWPPSLGFCQMLRTEM